MNDFHLMTDESIKERILAIQDDSVFGKNLYNYYEFISWARWYPDLFIDLLRTEKSNFNMHFDQRVFEVRCTIYEYVWYIQSWIC